MSKRNPRSQRRTETPDAGTASSENPEGEEQDNGKLTHLGVVPPTWKEIKREPWGRFKDMYERYTRNCEVTEPRSFYACIADQVRRTIYRFSRKTIWGEESNVPDGAATGCKRLVDLEWTEAQAVIDALLAPSTAIQATLTLERIVMQEVKRAGEDLRVASVNYIDQVEQFLATLDTAGTRRPEEKALVKAFVAGVRPRGVKERLRKMQPQTLEEAFQQLMDLEEIIRIAEENKDVFSGATGNTGNKKEPTRKERDDREEDEKRKKGQRKKACFRCGRTNHIEADCWATTDNKGNPLEDKKGTLLTMKIKVDGTGSLRTKETNRKETKSNDMEATIRFEGTGRRDVECHMLADTGASDNFVSPSVLGTRHPEIKILKRSKEHRQYRTGSGKLMHTHETVMLQVKSVITRKGATVDIDREVVFRVANTGFPCILGREFLVRNNLIGGPLIGNTEKHLKVIQKTGEEGEEVPYDDQEFMHVKDETIRQRFKILMENNRDLFKSIEHGACMKPATIEFDKGQRYPQQAMPRIAEKQIPIVERELREMIRLNVLERSDSPASSRFLIVPKQNGEVRVTTDFRELNLKCEHIKETVPTVRELLTRVRGAKVFCSLDLTKFFWQLPLSKQSRWLTAMSTPIGKLQYARVPMGLTDSPAIGARFLNKILDNPEKTQGRGTIAYVDDILVYASDYDNLAAELEQTLMKLREAGLRLSRAKARIAVTETDFIGHTITAQGISPKISRLQGVEKLQPPTNKKQARSFCGIMNYSREYIPNLSRILTPIFQVTGSNRHFKWGETQQKAFEEAKRAFLKMTPLAWFDENKKTFLETDASEIGIGAVLYQRDKEGQRFNIGFYSQAFNQTQQKWSTIEQEAFGIWRAVEHWRHLLWGRSFVTRTDHANLRYMEKSINKKVGRWWADLCEYDMTVEHVPGVSNSVADGLSRLPMEDTIMAFEEVQMEGESSNKDPPIDNSKHKAESQRKEKEVPNADQGEDLSEIDAAFDQVHNAMTGHLGIEATVKKIGKLGLCSEYPPKSILKRVQERIKSCAWCQKDRAKAPETLEELKVTSTNEPFQHISVDTIGPLPVDEEGNEYIVVVIDNFTRFIELFASPDTSAAEAAKALVSVTGRYGRISTMTSDRGPQYANETIKQLQQILRIKHHKTWPYHPQANGKVERSIQEVVRHLRALTTILKIQKRWTSILPMVQRICNSTVNRRTGVAPAELLYGQAVDVDRNMIKASGLEKTAHPQQLLRDLIRVQDRLIAKAIQTQSQADEYYLAKSPSQPTEFTVGTLVLATYVDGKRPHKLMSKYEGPMKITEKNGKNYVCQHLATGKRARYDVTRLHEYIPDENNEILEVASFDNQEEIVEKVTDHRRIPGKRKTNKSSYEFEILWNDKTKEWLNYRDVKNTEPFGEYIQSVGLTMFAEDPRKESVTGEGSVADEK